MHVTRLLLLALGSSSLEAGLSYGHALQAAGKRELPAEQLMHFQTRVLGPYRVGAGIPEMTALASAAAATWSARGDRAVRTHSAASLLAISAAFAVWAAAVQPVNRRLSTWQAGAEQQQPPPDWAALRDRWHRLHGLRLALLGVAALSAARGVERSASR